MQKYYSPEFNKNDIKIIAFDFDETFYKSDNMRALYLDYIRRTFKMLCEFDDEKIERIMQERGYTLESKVAPSFSQICTEYGVSEKDYHNYRIVNNFEIDYANAKVVDIKILKQFKKKYKIYIVSNEIDRLLYKKMERLKIPSEMFDGIYCTPIDAMKTKSKDKPYLEILKKNKLSPKNLLVVGDRYKVDIEPALNLGANGILVNGPEEIELVLKELI